MADRQTALTIDYLADDRPVHEGTRITAVASQSLAECSLDRDNDGEAELGF